MKKKLKKKKMNKKNKNNDLFYLQSELKKTELLLEITKRIAGLKDLSQILWTIIDSCTSWEWNGDEDRVNVFSTSSQSGVIDFSGWLTDVPRKGRQYFYYDLDISTTLEHKMIQYYNDNDLPTFGVF